MIRKTIAAAGIILALAQVAAAQDGASSYTEIKSSYTPVPFGIGEKMTYQVSLGIVGQVGSGSLEVDTIIDTIRGRPVYQLRFKIQGGVMFARVNDDYRSWFDVERLVSLRFKQDQKEVRYERHRDLDFFPAERRYKSRNSDEAGVMATDAPLDDVSFLYFVRTLPLEVGKTYTMNRYFKDDGNPVTVKVLGKETIKTPAGTFRTIVVRPIIKSKGLFSEGGQAKIYFSDDSRRIMVALKSKVKVLKSLDMYLDGYSPGHRPGTIAK